VEVGPSNLAPHDNEEKLHGKELATSKVKDNLSKTKCLNYDQLNHPMKDYPKLPEVTIHILEVRIFSKEPSWPRSMRRKVKPSIY
jgi:hypothetical protein